MSRPQTLTVYGNTTVSTSQKKFGNGSIYFDGNGDYIKSPSSTDYQFGSGAWTIELWLYRTGSPGAIELLLDFRSASPQVTPGLFLDASYHPCLVVNGTQVITGSAVVSLNTWTHIAVSKSGTSTKIFVNGTQTGSTYTDNNTYIQSPLTIGARFDNTLPFFGYFDEIRISKGIARYTTNFTSPTSQFTNDQYTSLLIHGDSTISDYYGTVNIAEASLSASSEVSVNYTRVIDLQAKLEDYIEYNYIDSDYIYNGGSSFSLSGSLEKATGQVIEAYGDWNSSAETTATVGAIFDTSVALESIFEQQATISYIYGVDLFAFSEALLTTQAEVIRDTNIELSTQFDVAITAVRGIYVSAQSDAIFESIISEQRVRYDSAALTAAVSMIISPSRIQQANFDNSTTGEWSNTFVSSINANAFFRTTKELVANTTQNTLPLRIFGLSSNVASAFSMSSSVKIKGQRPRILDLTSGTVSFNASSKVLGTHSLSIETNSSVIYESTDQYYIRPNEDFIIELFVNPTSFSSTRNPNTIFQYYNPSAGWSIGISNSGKLIFSYFYKNNSVERIIESTGSNLNTGSWHFIRVRKVGSTVYLYQSTYSTSWSEVTQVASVSTSLLNSLGQSPGNGPLIIGNSPTNYFSGLVDEIYFARGTNTPAQFLIPGTPNAINTGKEPTTQILLHLDNNYVDDTSGPTNANATLNSSAYLTTSVNKISNDSGSLNSNLTLSSNALRIRPLSSALQSEGFLVAAFGRIRPFVDIEVSSVTLSADTSITAQASSALVANSNVDCIVNKNIGTITIHSSADSNQITSAVRTTDTPVILIANASVLSVTGKIMPQVADLSSSFEISAKAEVGKIAECYVTATSNLTAVVTKQLGEITASGSAVTTMVTKAIAIPQGGVNMPVESLQSTIGTRIRYNSSDISSIANLTIDVDVIRGLNANLNSSITSEIKALRIKHLQGGFSALFAEMAITAKIGDFLVDCTVDTNLSANAVSKLSNSARLESTTQVTSVSKVNKTFDANLVVNTFELAVAESGLIGGADLQATTQMITDGDVIRSAITDLAVISQLTCRLDAVREGISIEMSFGTLEAVASRTRDIESDLTVTSEISAKLSSIKQLQGNLLVEGFVLSTGKVINLTVSETWIVASDTYDWLVPKETRSYSIERETRTYIIEGI